MWGMVGGGRQEEETSKIEMGKPGTTA